MEDPFPDLEQIFPGMKQVPRRQPLHRTRRAIHTTDDDLRRDLHRIHERAEFDEEGYLSNQIDEELICLDCDCTFTKSMAGRCNYCNPPARLCPVHMAHCEVCGHGVCRAHTTEIRDPESGGAKTYCPRHRNWVRTKQVVRGFAMAMLHPFVSRDRRP